MRFRQVVFRYLAVLGFGAFLFSGCSTDLDPNAEYKEVMVLYSILNQADTVHYAKVNKAFLNTNSNALTIAATNPDSTTYPEENLVVKLERLTIKNGDSLVLNSYPMERFVSTNKEAGTFFGPNQVLYRTKPNQPGPLTDEESIYRIVATNPKSGLSTSGATQLIQLKNNSRSERFSIFKVSFAGSGYPPLDQIDTSKYEPEKLNRIEFRGPVNASIYTVKLTFNYTESDGTTTQNKQLSWYIRNNFLQDVKDIRFEVENRLFYTNLLNLIDTSQDKPGTFRTAGEILVTITAGSESLATNYRINNSFSIFSQVKPEWDNIKNGTGLIGARAQRTVKTVLSQAALAELINNSQYQKLKFK
ncbi:hypothetical protein I5M27_03730 [Adhaeribacter sp. BT258]|uniref:DUF4249 family protein n=1 Tax=Adhaeribacter terrigena TaxID=2793070 RepID=A0ABS1BY55_9BACT|nr:hypothetical protein [Adhaeribacter terrigena]MBK0402079.1 hypothetical protein [Adhaeribacter terrigena]